MAQKIGISLLLAFALCAIANGSAIKDDTPKGRVIPELQGQLAKVLSMVVVERLLERSTNEFGVRVPVLPQLPDPLTLPDTTIVELPLAGIDAEIYLCNSTTIGLSKLTDNIRVLPAGKSVQIIYDLTTDTLGTQGLQSAKLDIPEFDFSFRSGFGGYELTLVNGALHIEFLLEINIVTQRIHVSNLTIDLDFESLSVNFDQATYNGEPVAWDTVNEGIKERFLTYWPMVKTSLQGLIVSVFELLFKNCILSDLINLDFSCIGTRVEIANPLELLEVELQEVFKVSLADACPAQQEPTSTTSEDTSETKPESTTEASETTPESSTDASETTPESTTDASETTPESTTDASETTPESTTDASETTSPQPTTDAFEPTPESTTVAGLESTTADGSRSNLNLWSLIGLLVIACLKI